MAKIKPHIPVTIGALLGLGAAVFAAIGQWRLAGATAGALLAVIAVLTLDIRYLSIDILRQVTSLSSRVNELFTESRLSAGEIPSRADLGSLADSIARLETSLAAQQFTEQVSRAVNGQTREVEALLQLYAWVKPNEPMPPSGQWAMNPQGLLALIALVRRNRPRIVLELGSGTSTIWIGHALASNGPVEGNGSTMAGRLVSLDHDPGYAARSQELADLHSDEMAPAEIRVAPLTPLRLGTEEYFWYSREALKDITGIDMLIIDGPPGGTCPLARYPAVPILIDRLADGAMIVLDDATRDDEKAAAERWIAEIAGITRQSSPISRLAMFRYSAKG